MVRVEVVEVAVEVLVEVGARMVVRRVVHLGVVVSLQRNGDTSCVTRGQWPFRSAGNNCIL